VKTPIEWPPLACLALATSLALALPDRYKLLASSASLALALGVALLGLIASLAARGHRASSRIINGVIIGTLGLFTVLSFITLLGVLLGKGPPAKGWTLLKSAASVWCDNVLTFALLFWFFDRGGPAARREGRSSAPEWLFPEMSATGFVRPNWQPHFLDYLFVALTTATAFSPTDTPPLSTRARLLLSVEACISLVTIALVAARAVNVLS
jgi:hypothetical protein